MLRDLHQAYCIQSLNLKPNSAAQILYSVNNFRRFLKREPTTEDFTKPVLIDFMKSFPNPRTANGNRTNLLTLWRFAEEENLIAPPPRIQKRNVPLREPVVFTLYEVKRLWEATDLLEGDWGGVPIRQAWKVAIAVLWDTAARIGTLLQAELAEVNLTTGTWHVPAEHLKGGRADRVFQLHPDTISVIRDSRTTRKLLFPFPYRKEAAERHLGKILILADLPHSPKHKFHCLRRTAESYAAANMGIEAAAEAVGHSVQIARKHYVSQSICKPPSLVNFLPRPF